MINAAKVPDGAKSSPVVADLHPARPDFRGMQPPGLPPVSLEADPSFADIEAAGAVLQKQAEAHVVLDGMFMISGEIPRTTPYEDGLRGGLRFSKETEAWTSDELIMDERLVMCNIKGKILWPWTSCGCANKADLRSNSRKGSSRLYWLQPCRRCQRISPRA
jgi:7,8-dihydropterin-6-yl-methyl-4-(beta-D-ribofuranosyl)aminobenzene 5'-phosphate synthase